jgi:hypothetical protein
VTRRLLLSLLLLGGCTWSNSLYQAHHFMADAERAEADHSPDVAQTAWGQAAVRADSAYARAPKGRRGAEARWVAGHARVQLRDCAGAVKAFEGAVAYAAIAPWGQQLRLEMAECQEVAGNEAALASYDALLNASDPSVRRLARIRLGHVRILRGDWAAAAELLNGEDTLPARLDRALALAHLGRTGDAMRDLAPVLDRADTSVAWATYVDALAGTDTRGADALLNRLDQWPDVSPQQRADWLLAAARGATAFDAAATDRRLAELGTLPPSRAVTIGRMLSWQRRLLGAGSTEALRAVLDSVPASANMPEGIFEASQLNDEAQFAKRALARSDSLAPGATRGDLALFTLGEFARDTIASLPLARYFFSRIEQQWPASPYVAKALFARRELEPDSSIALLQRLQQMPTNPYVASALGNVAAQAQRSRLEDSLGRFARGFWVGVEAPTRVVQER